MDRNMKYQNNQNFRRTQDVELSTKQKDSIANISIGHFAAGNHDAFMLGFTTLSKISTQNALITQLDAQGTMLDAIKTKVGL